MSGSLIGMRIVCPGWTWSQFSIPFAFKILIWSVLYCMAKSWSVSPFFRTCRSTLRAICRACSGSLCLEGVGLEWVFWFNVFLNAATLRKSCCVFFASQFTKAVSTNKKIAHFFNKKRNLALQNLIRCPCKGCLIKWKIQFLRSNISKWEQNCKWIMDFINKLIGWIRSGKDWSSAPDQFQM